jgi:hypothetical protein
MAAVKFDLGMALIKAVIEYRSDFMYGSTQDPAKVLKVNLNREARDAILRSMGADQGKYMVVDMSKDQCLETLVGIPVVLNPGVRIMDIFEVKGGN